MIKNLTLSVEDNLLQRARSRAALEKRTLNAAFREWLGRYADKERGYDNYQNLMSRLGYVEAGDSFSRPGERVEPRSLFELAMKD